MLRRKIRHNLSEEESAKIRDLARLCVPGTRSYGHQCPVCSGGRTGEKSLGVSVDGAGTTFYRCFRGRCSVSGRLGGERNAGWGSPIDPPRKLKTAPPKMDLPNLFSVEGSLWAEKLGRDYGITWLEASRADWRVANKKGDNETLYIPINSPLKVRRGYEARPISPASNGGKSRSIRGSDDVGDVPWAAYFPTASTKGENRPLVIVEDCISALKVSRHADAYALIGTNISTDKALEINDLTVRRKAFLCLDKDATDRASELCKRYRFVCPMLRLTPISRDLKYYSDKELLEVVDV